ncbi:MAG: hypothetical protein L0241_20805 [Planctomycetia bacterium]|nr:hypothetical protein [Planctomycetia bacterium]
MTAPTTQSRSSTRLAVDLAKTLPLTDAAKSLITPTLSARQFFDMLAAQPQLAEDAIRFLAVALPKREAVWWALLCVRSALLKPPPEALKAISAAEGWVKQQTEASRRACGEAAELAGHGTAGGCLADAAFWSGGSLTPAHLAVIAPREDLTSIAVAAAILLAAVIDPENAVANRAKFVALGLDVANGKLKWQ